MTRSATYDAVVVGAGHNGLVCGAYLARAGLRTLILERAERVGGAAVTAELAPGIGGPLLADTVQGFRLSVVRDLGLARHGVRFIHPDVQAFAPYPDGGAVTLWSDPGQTAEGLRGRWPKDAAAYPGFDRRVRSLASFMAYLHAALPPDLKTPHLEDALTGVKLARAYRRLGPKAGREVLRVLPMAVADFVKEAVEAAPLGGVLATRGIRYTAMGPWSAGTTAVLLAASVGGGGAAGRTTFVAGGPGALTEALAAAARSFGAELRCGTEVVRIASNGTHATGVALADGTEIAARTVVSNADPKRTLLGLADFIVVAPTLAWRAENIRTPGTVAKVNLVLSGLPAFTAAGGDPSLLRGRIVIAPSIDHVERAFDASKYGRISEAPYLDATIPTLADPSLAPDGKHVMSVLFQYAPYRLREGDWEAEPDGVGDLALKVLEEYAPGLSDLVEVRQVITPLDLERDHGLTGGHPMHAEPGLDQFFAWRPLLGHARYRFGLDGLYLCGAGAHPGGGVTGAPGAGAARRILSDLKASR